MCEFSDFFRRMLDEDIFQAVYQRYDIANSAIRKYNAEHNTDYSLYDNNLYNRAKSVIKEYTNKVNNLSTYEKNKFLYKHLKKELEQTKLKLNCLEDMHRVNGERIELMKTEDRIRIQYNKELDELNKTLDELKNKDAQGAVKTEEDPFRPALQSTKYMETDKEPDEITTLTTEQEELTNEHEKMEEEQEILEIKLMHLGKKLKKEDLEMLTDDRKKESLDDIYANKLSAKNKKLIYLNDDFLCYDTSIRSLKMEINEKLKAQEAAKGDN
jgi:hypothetical protein